MPDVDVLVRRAARDVEHDDGALAVDVVPVAESAEALLPCGVPAVEAQLALVRVKVERAHLDADRGLVLLLELARDVPLQEGRLARAAVAHDDELERRDALRVVPPAEPCGGKGGRASVHLHARAPHRRPRAPHVRPA